MVIRVRFVTVWTCALFVLGSHAHAQQAPDRDVDATEEGDVDPAIEARALFERGIELTREERWGEALEYFRRSGTLVERPSTTFNMAVALIRLGRPTEGLSTLDDYLRASENVPREDGRREEAHHMLEIALHSIATLTLDVNPPTAQVRIDGELRRGQGASRELRIDPGTHRVNVGADGYASMAFELSVLDGERTSRRVHLEEIPRAARLQITSNVDTARVLVDEAEVGRGSWMGQLDPGRYQIEVRADGYEPFAQTVELARAEHADVHAVLGEVESAWRGPWPWIVGSVLLVGAAVGVGVAVATSGSDTPYGGSTGVVLEGLRMGR